MLAAQAHGGLGHTFVGLSPLALLQHREAVARLLEGLDLLYCNCGPLTTLALAARADGDLDLRIVREVHTLGWIGCHFQEWVAHELGRESDTIVFPSRYAAAAWHHVSGPGRPIVHQPVAVSVPEAEVRVHLSATAHTIRAGYFSRLAEDKGFCYLPEIVRASRQTEWPITDLVVAGSHASKRTATDALRAVESTGCRVKYHGELTRTDTLEVMSCTDVVLFPSVSSFESLGRVVVEALALGKRVIASDYCAGHDLVPPTDRLRIRPDDGPASDGLRPVPVATLDVEGWAPSWEYASDRQAIAFDRYSADPEAFLTKVLGFESAFALDDDHTSGTLQCMWAYARPASAPEACHAYWELLRDGRPQRSTLSDLAGPVKHAITRAGFRMRVSVRPPMSPR